MHHKIRPREILRHRNRRLKALAAFLLSSILGGFIYWRLQHYGWVSTDDAFVAGHVIPLKAQTDGTVVELLAENTQPVKKGEVLVRLDGTHALINLQQAEAELAETVRNIAALKAKAATLKQRINAKEAALGLVRHDLNRFEAAAKEGAASAQQVQNTQDKIRESDATLREARAELSGVEAQLGLSSIPDHPAVEKAKSRLRRAFLDYQRRNVIAPVSGYVAKRKVQIGDTLKTGTPLLVIVPLSEVWIEANFLETQIAAIRLGQAAEIRIDAYGEQRLYHGRVQGINPATGSTFALLPTDNSTGNFIHIAERLQVRIGLDAQELHNQPLQTGLSTFTRINTLATPEKATPSTLNLNHEAYRTDIYAHELDTAEQQIQQIIHNNLPNP